MTEDRDFLTRQVIAMIEEEASDLIGAEVCQGHHEFLAGMYGNCCHYCRAAV